MSNLLKSTNSPHTVRCALMEVGGLGAIEEVLDIDAVIIVLGGTPVTSACKSADCSSLRIHQVQFVLRGQKPIAVPV